MVAPRIPFSAAFPGKVGAQVRHEYEVSRQTLRNWIRDGIPPIKLAKLKKVAAPAAPMTWREYAMIEEYKQGKTLAEIGSEYDITRERVRQLISKHGVKRQQGGGFVRTTGNRIAKEKQRAEKKSARVARWEKFFGCSWDMITAINGKPWVRTPKMRADCPCNAYYNQWHAAFYVRNVGWEINLVDWWRIWQESGHWEQRGRGKGYCMTRIGDTGPYHPDNVEIKTCGENFSESYYKHPASKRREKAIANRLAREAAFGSHGADMLAHARPVSQQVSP